MTGSTVTLPPTQAPTLAPSQLGARGYEERVPTGPDGTHGLPASAAGRSPARNAGQERSRHGAVHRGREIEALGGAAADLAEEAELVGGLHAFGDHVRPGF